MNLVIKYSIESEADRIGGTLDKYNWFKENKYRVNLPESIKDKAEKGETVEHSEILEVLNREYKEDVYSNAEKILITEFSKIKQSFEENLKKLNGPIFESYNLSITKYGVGGSYRTPNNIQVNIDYGKEISWKTIAHEIVHLTIEDWIKEFKIDHWSKERIVDLIMTNFFPNQVYIQGNHEDKKEISEIFNQYFPDIKRVIVEVSKL
ncbi:MAG: hypothetical protein ACYC1K_00485 [Minisyncoccota bacterium]